VTEADFLAQVDAWALGGLSSQEEAQMAAYLAGQPSPAALQAHRRAFATAALLAASLPPAPPREDAWRRIEAALPKLPNGVASVTPLVSARRWRSAGWVAAGMAAVAVLWLIVDRSRGSAREAELRGELRDAQLAMQALRTESSSHAATRGELDGCLRDLTELRTRDALAAEAVGLLELPGTQLIPLERKAEATKLAANAVYHRGVKRAYVVAAGMPADAAASYQVWLVRAGKRLEAGRLVAGLDGRAIARVPTLTLDDGVPESFQITRANGEIVLESKIRI
jgi:hypothetical protein